MRRGFTHGCTFVDRGDNTFGDIYVVAGPLHTFRNSPELDFLSCARLECCSGARQKKVEMSLSAEQEVPLYGAHASLGNLVRRRLRRCAHVCASWRSCAHQGPRCVVEMAMRSVVQIQIPISLVSCMQDTRRMVSDIIREHFPHVANVVGARVRGGGQFRRGQHISPGVQ